MSRRDYLLAACAGFAIGAAVASLALAAARPSGPPRSILSLIVLAGLAGAAIVGNWAKGHRHNPTRRDNRD